MTNREWLIQELCKDTPDEKVIKIINRGVCNGNFYRTRCSCFESCQGCTCKWLKEEHKKD